MTTPTRAELIAGPPGTCRYLNSNDQMCAEPAPYPWCGIELCTDHVAAVIRMVTVTAPVHGEKLMRALRARRAARVPCGEPFARLCPRRVEERDDTGRRLVYTHGCRE